MPAFIRMSCLLGAALCLTACAPMLSLVGTNQTLVQVVAQIERVKVVGDGASYMASSKTVTDHALSAVVDKDCKVFNVFSREPVCTAKPANSKVKVSLGSTSESPPQPAMPATVESGPENSAPAPAPSGG